MRAFVAGPWLEDLDLDGMQPMPATFHADSGERGEGDMVWRVPRRTGGDTYLLLLMEFQSTADPWMASRILVYTGSLWQLLVKTRRLPQSGKLTPVLPVVVYNSEPRWRPSLAPRDLIGLPAESPLSPWQPDIRYYLIDEGAFDLAELAARDGLPALLFRLQGASSPPEVVAVAKRVLAWLDRHPGFSEARSVFAQLLGALLAPLDPRERVPDDLVEVRNMLATRAEQRKQEGRLKGRQEGGAALLLRQSGRRFETLPNSVRQRVLTADTATLEQWGTGFSFRAA